MIEKCNLARCRLWNGSAFLRCMCARFRICARPLGDVCLMRKQVRDAIEAAKLMYLVMSVVGVHAAYR